MDSASVNLAADPPFNTKRQFNAPYCKLWPLWRTLKMRNPSGWRTFKWDVRCACAAFLLYALAIAPSCALAEDCEPKSSIVSTVEGYYERNKNRAPNYGQDWKRVLVSFGERDDDTAFSVDEARARQAAWVGWKPVADELQRLEDCGFDPVSARVQEDQEQYEAQVQAHQYSLHSLDLAQSRFGSQESRLHTSATRQDLTEGDTATGIGVWVSLKQNQQPYQSPATLTAAVPLEARTATSSQGGLLYGTNLNNLSWSAWADISTHFNLSAGPQASGVSGDATLSTGWTQESGRPQGFMFPFEVTHIGDSVFTAAYTWYQIRVKGQAATNQRLVLRYQDDDNPAACTATVSDIVNCEHTLDIEARFLDNLESKALREGEQVQVKVQFRADTDYPGPIEHLHTLFLANGKVCFDEVDFGRSVNDIRNPITQMDYWGIHFPTASRENPLSGGQAVTSGRFCVPYAGVEGWTRTEGAYDDKKWIRLSKVFWIGRRDDDEITGDSEMRTWTPVFSDVTVASWPTQTYPLSFSVEEDDVSTAHLKWRAGASHRDASIVIEREMFYDCHSFTGDDKISMGTQRLTFTPPASGAAGNAYSLRISATRTRTQESGTGDNGRRVFINVNTAESARQIMKNLLKPSPLVRKLPSWTLTVEEVVGYRMDDGDCVRDAGLYAFNEHGERVVPPSKTVYATGGQDASGGHHEIEWGRRFVYQAAGNEAFRIILNDQDDDAPGIRVNTTAYGTSKLFDLPVIQSDGTESGTVGSLLAKDMKAACSMTEMNVSGATLAGLPDGFTQDMFRLRVQGGTQDLCRGL